MTPERPDPGSGSGPGSGSRPLLSARERRITVLSASLLLGLLGSGVLVWQGTAAIFSASVTSGTNSWSTGDVSLTEDHVGSYLFDVTGLTPGGSDSNCIVVSYGGSYSVPVRVYSGGITDPDGIAPYLHLRIEEGEEGTGGDDISCGTFTPSATIHDGTLSAFADLTSAAEGVGSWTASTSDTTRAYRLTYTLSASIPTDKQATTASVTFTWESRVGS
jgi:hypothetical protein